MNLRADYFIGKQSENEWAGVYGYRPADEADVSNSELFAIIKIKTDATFPDTAHEGSGLERIAKMLLDEYQQSFYSDSTSENEIIKIEKSLHRVKDKLDLILSREEAISEAGLDIELAIVLVSEDVAYCAVLGESRIFVLRQDKLVEISKVLVDGDLRGFAKTGSLKLLETDKVALVTSAASGNSELIYKALNNLNISKLEEIRQDQGVAILFFGSEDLEWNFDDNQPIKDPSYMSEISAPVFVEGDEEFVSSSDENEESLVAEPQEEVETIPESRINSKPNFIPIEQEDQELEEIAPQESEEVKEESLLSKLKPLVSNVKTSAAEKIGALRNRGEGSENSGDENSFEEEEQTTNALSSAKMKLSDLSNSLKNSKNDKTYIRIIKQILEKISQLLATLVVIVRREFLGGGDRMDRYQHVSRRERNRKILIVVVIVGVILIYFGLKDAESRRVANEKTESVESEIIELNNEYNQLSLQVNAVKNQEQEKKDLVATKLSSIVTRAQTLKKEGIQLDELDELIENAIESKDAVQLIKALSNQNLEVITDIGKLHSDTVLSDLVLTDGALFASDSKRNVVYKINPILNSTPTEYIKNLDNPELLVTNTAGEVVVYDNNQTSSISKFSPSTGELYRFPYLTPGIIGRVNGVGIYSGNDSLYEIHQNHQQIFRRDKDGQNYYGGGAIYTTSNPPNWKTDPEFSKAIDISIPYEIYVLIEGGGLKRYLAGGENSLTYESFINFSRNDFDSIRNATSFEINGNYLLVGDSKNKRVLLFEIQDNEQKNVEFVQQYVYRGSENTLGSIKEIAIDQQSGIFYVLDGSKIIKLTK